MKDVPAGTERTKVGDEMPQGMERRLVLRLLSYWRSLCGTSDFPSFVDVDPDEIPDMWPHCFVIEIFEDDSEPVFRALGDELAASVDYSLNGLGITQAAESTLPAVAIAFLPEVLQKGVPVSRGDEFFKADGTQVLYRSILLPMSDDGDNISGILGAVNCREIPPEEQ
jgi:hypothetical protein